LGVKSVDLPLYLGKRDEAILEVHGEIGSGGVGESILGGVRESTRCSGINSLLHGISFVTM